MLRWMVGAAVLAAACGGGSDGTPGAPADAGPGADADAAVAVHQLEVEVLGEAPGAVTSADGSIACPPTCTADLAQGTSVELTANVELGRAFAGWSGACAGDQPTCTLSVTSDLAVAATFEHDTRTVTLVRSGPGRGSLVVENWGAEVGSPLDCGDSCSGQFSVGGHLWVNAAPAFGSRSGAWSGCPVVAGTGTCFIDQLSDDLTVVGRFILGSTWNGTGNDRSVGLATTADSGVYMIGTFTEQLTFGNRTLTGTGTPPFSFIVKFDPTLTTRWAERVPRATSRVIPDSAGNAVVASEYVPSASFAEWHVQRLAAVDGTREDASGIGELHIHALASTAGGNIAVAGTMEDTVVSQGRSITSAGGQDIFVGVLDADTWEWIWFRRFGNGTAEAAYAVAVGTEGDVWVVGTLYDTGTAGGEAFDIPAGYGAFVARYDALTGNHVASWSLPGGDSTLGRAVQVMPGGNLRVLGAFYGTANFGGDDLVAPPGGGLFMVELDPAGQHVTSWGNDIGGDYLPGIALAADGDVAFTRGLQGTITLPIGTFESAGVSDMLVGRLDGATGSYEWASSLGGESRDEPGALAFDALGRLFLAGSFSGDGDFGAHFGDFDIVLVPHLEPPPLYP
jgi:hypothetical protein